MSRYSADEHLTRGKTIHPSGIRPKVESMNLDGNSAAVASSIPSGFRPLALAFTGSKSTNQDLNNVRAMPSSVSFIRWLSSILLSRDCNKLAIECCSCIGGIGNLKFG